MRCCWASNNIYNKINVWTCFRFSRWFSCNLTCQILTVTFLSVIRYSLTLLAIINTCTQFHLFRWDIMKSLYSKYIETNGWKNNRLRLIKICFSRLKETLHKNSTKKFRDPLIIPFTWYEARIYSKAFGFNGSEKLKRFALSRELFKKNDGRFSYYRYKILK